MAISQQYIKLNKTVNPLIYRGKKSIYGSPDHKLYLPVNDLYHNKQFLLNIFFCNGLLEKKKTFYIFEGGAFTFLYDLAQQRIVLFHIICFHVFYLLKTYAARVELRGCPSYFCRDRGAPLIFAETWCLTVCEFLGTATFLLKKCLPPPP